MARNSRAARRTKPLDVAALIEKMKLVVLPTEKLTPCAKNPRINDGAVDAVAASIKAFGFSDPIVVRGTDNEIINGHTRWKAAKQLGLKRVPCLRGDHLTEAEVRALTKGKVPCVEMDLDEADRMLLTIRINRAKGSHIALKMADIIKTLVNDHGLTLDEICNQIGATKDEVDLLLMENVFKAKGIDEKTPFSRAWIPAVKGGRRLGGGAGAQKPAQTRKSGHRSARRR